MPKALDRSQTGIPEIDDDPELFDIARTRHPVNAIITEFDWLLADELAIAKGLNSVSDVLREALDFYTSQQLEVERARRETLFRLQAERDRRRRAKTYVRSDE